MSDPDTNLHNDDPGHQREPAPTAPTTPQSPTRPQAGPEQPRHHSRWSYSVHQCYSPSPRSSRRLGAFASLGQRGRGRADRNPAAAARGAGGCCRPDPRSGGRRCRGRPAGAQRPRSPARRDPGHRRGYAGGDSAGDRPGRAGGGGCEAAGRRGRRRARQGTRPGRRGGSARRRDGRVRARLPLGDRQRVRRRVDQRRRGSGEERVRVATGVLLRRAGRLVRHERGCD